MHDVDFPIISFQVNDSPRQRGLQHGETFKDAIAELIDIRTRLMLEKNPSLNQIAIEKYAAQQWEVTCQFDSLLGEELQGIAEGAGVSLTDLVILNNYTDFRDIEVESQGCSVVYVNRDGNRIAGQTWDMHRSAKRFVCCLHLPAGASDSSQENDRSNAIDREMIIFSVVGCVGMMGFVSDRSASGSSNAHAAVPQTLRMVGVNNLNTLRAKPGILWPVMIRKLLAEPDRHRQRELLKSSPLTSGRSFLLAGGQGAEFWEVTPEVQECVSHLSVDQQGHLFHTNHCLGQLTKKVENAGSLSSTTHRRYELIQRKINSVTDLETAWKLLNDHEGYPQSICSNFQTSSQDPSVTCGGAVADLDSGLIRLWRGDPLYDTNSIQHTLGLIAN